MNERVFLSSEIFEVLRVNDDEEELDRLLLAASYSNETRQPALLSGPLHVPVPVAAQYTRAPVPCSAPSSGTSPAHTGSTSRFAKPKTDKEIQLARERERERERASEREPVQ